MSETNFTIEFLTDSKTHYLSDNHNLSYTEKPKLNLQDFTLYHIQEITFEDKLPRKEALENVIGSLRIGGINFVYIIIGEENKVSFYFGVAKDYSSKIPPPIPIFDIGEFVLLPSLRGNFRGSVIMRVGENDLQEKSEIIEKIQKMEHACYLEGVPGVNEDNEHFQGSDRLVDVMLRDEFAVVVIAKPLLRDDIESIENNLNKAYSSIVPFVKETLQDGLSETTGESETISKGTSEGSSVNESTAEQNGKSISISESDAFGYSTSKSNTTGESNTPNSGKGSSKSNTSGGSETQTKTNTSGNTNNESETKTKGTAINKSTTESVSKGDSKSRQTSHSKTTEFIRKEIQDWIKYLDETIFTRLDYGKGRGLFITTTVLLSSQLGSLLKLENTIKSLYSGDTGNKVALKKVELSNKDNKLRAFKNLQIPLCNINPHITDNEIYGRSALSQFVCSDKASVGSWISTKELSLIAGLPQREIVGMGLREEVEFGLNIPISIKEGCKIDLGYLVQGGKKLNIPISIDKNHLNKHTFVTGVTGSGKTTTCQSLLIKSKLPFIVIEPAKTEYRILTKIFDDLLIFTLGRDSVAPFRLNPFEFFSHETITSRVDMIKASIEAAFDMEAAIPQIIETSIYECYKDYGWNISTNKNSKYKTPFADGVYAFPVLSDLLKKTQEVVEAQGFDERLKRDYIGSIKARLQGLVVGAKGLMLDTKRSADFRDLLKRRVILEIEEIRSSAEKSLIIGFVLTNLIEAVKAEFYENRNFKHITLIEEAHRLLSKFSPGDSLSKKQSVETFTDMLAEVRKYGECLIISDQIPSALAPEVLKNTNTKIVHKIFSQDDKDAIGNTMALSEEQKGFLSNLDIGRAILFTQGYKKAMQVSVTPETDTTGDFIINDKKIRLMALRYYCNFHKRGIFLGTENLPDIPEPDVLEEIIGINSDERFVSLYSSYVQKAVLSDELKTLIKIYAQKLGSTFLMSFILDHFYLNDYRNSEQKRIAAVHNFIECIVQNKPDAALMDSFDYLRYFREEG